MVLLLSKSRERRDGHELARLRERVSGFSSAARVRKGVGAER